MTFASATVCRKIGASGACESLRPVVIAPPVRESVPGLPMVWFRGGPTPGFYPLDARDTRRFAGIFSVLG